MAKIILSELRKRFNETEAVRGIDLDIAHNEFVVLVGPSGCGKSTTLRMIAGLEEITSGEIFIGERLINDVPPKDRDIAMVFQNYALYPHMTVYKNMAFGLQLRRTARDEIERRVRDAADILNIAELLERRPKQLSGGQRQRVAMGRAIVRDPEAFLYDEPATRFVAGFIGSPAMNFIPCRVVAEGEEITVRLGDDLVLAVPTERRALRPPGWQKHDLRHPPGTHHRAQGPFRTVPARLRIRGPGAGAHGHGYHGADRYGRHGGQRPLGTAVGRRGRPEYGFHYRHEQHAPGRPGQRQGGVMRHRATARLPAKLRGAPCR